MNNQKKINILAAIILESILQKNFNNFVSCQHSVDEENFFIDFITDEKISSNDFNKLEKLMQKIFSGAQKITEKKITINEAKSIFKKNKYYMEILNENSNLTHIYLITINDYQTFIFNEIGFEKTNVIKNFKLLSIGGSYWLNDAKNESLIKITGVAFDDKKMYEEYLIEYQERLDRDHRKIGKEMELFTFDLLAGQGLPIWLSNGSIIKKEIRNFLAELEFKYDFENVSTPILGDLELYKKSGHWAHYQENMFPLMNIDNEKLILRPMTCPHHILVYKKKQYSYKQLPIRLCEESMLHRYESSGGLTGLERVREMVLEDTHIFCTTEQIEQEVLNCYNIIKDAHKGLNSEIYQIDLSLHDPNNKEKFHKDPKMWKTAEDSLRKMLKKHKIPFVEKIGEAAFYGPKIDFQVKTALNKIITMSTIQLDFLLPMKFELEYRDANGEFKRPIMIHLGIIGTYERLVSILLEQTKGILPLWLSPIQIVIIPINNDVHMKYAKEIYDYFKQSLIRVKLDNRDERLNKKIREAQVSKIPYQLIIGDNEIKNKTISYRQYGSENTIEIALEKFNHEILNQIKRKC